LELCPFEQDHKRRFNCCAQSSIDHLTEALPGAPKAAPVKVEREVVEYITAAGDLLRMRPRLAHKSSAAETGDRRAEKAFGRLSAIFSSDLVMTSVWFRYSPAG
jgi:hypothetical protein